MKIRWTARRVRVRLDDLEVAALLAGQVLETALIWPGGGWTVRLDPARRGVSGGSASLTVGLQGELEALADSQRGEVTLPGPPPVDVEKDYRPEHLS